MKTGFKSFLLILISLVTLTSYSQEEEKNEVPFTVLEEIPKFPNCIDVSNENERNCFMQEMYSHIKMHFNYPRQAVKKKIQGRVTVMFLIDKEGYVKIVKTKAPEGADLLAEEAERIIKLLPRFKPGMQKGKAVGVSYAQPILFKL